MPPRAPLRLCYFSLNLQFFDRLVIAPVLSTGAIILLAKNRQLLSNMMVIRAVMFICMVEKYGEK